MKKSLFLITAAIIFHSSSSLADVGCGGSLEGLLQGPHLKDAVLMTTHTEFHCKAGPCYERVGLYKSHNGLRFKYEIVIDHDWNREANTLTECIDLTKTLKDRNITKLIQKIKHKDHIHLPQSLCSTTPFELGMSMGMSLNQNTQPYHFYSSPSFGYQDKRCKGHPDSLELIKYLLKGIKEGREKSVLLKLKANIWKK